ncbi:unnamed protein product [Closterium sp. Yama58-4]|nr:unnamed protein product [Closterium sp. Yama58-4]
MDSSRTLWSDLKQTPECSRPWSKKSLFLHVRNPSRKSPFGLLGTTLGRWKLAGCQAKKTVDITCSNRNEPPSPDAIRVTYRCTLHNHPLPARHPLTPIRRPPTRHIVSCNRDPTKCVNKRPADGAANHPNKRAAHSPEDLPTGRATDQHFNLAGSHDGVGDTPFNTNRPADYIGGLNAVASDFGAVLNGLDADSGGALNILIPASQNGSVEVGAADTVAAAAADGAVDFADWAAEALLHFPCQPELWDLSPLSPLPTLLQSSPPWRDKLPIPVSVCSTDLNSAAVDMVRCTVPLEGLVDELGCRMQEKDHSRRLDGEDSEDPTDEIDSWVLLHATVLGASTSSDAPGQAGLESHQDVQDTPL